MLNQILFTCQLAWRSIRTRTIQSLATLIVVGMALALFVAVAVLGNGVRRGIVLASDPFETVVVGAKGDGQQLVLSSILLNGNPDGLVSVDLLEELETDPRADLVIPLAMADNVGGARIVGTTTDFFKLEPVVGEASKFELDNGRYFTDLDIHNDHDDEDAHHDEDEHAHGDEDTHDDHGHEEAIVEAVLGSSTAELLGLSIGDTFFASHGAEVYLNEDVHDVPHEVVGILQPTNTAFDGGVFVSLPTVWDAHAHESHGGEGGIAQLETVDVELGEGMLSAVLIKPTGFVEANNLRQTINQRPDAQAVYPGEELGRLFDTFRQLERLLANIGYMAAVMAGLTIFLAIYSATVAREQMIAIIRGVGAGRGTVLGMVLIEAVLIAIIGALIARALGYGAASLIGQNLAAQNGIPIPLSYVWEIEPLLWGLPIVMGLLAGAIPALLTYRLNVVDKLFK